MSTTQFIIICGVVSVIVSVISILVSTSHGCNWLLEAWRKLGKGWGRDI